MTTTPSLDPETTNAAVSAERLAVADLVAGLDDRQLATQSLCDAWTVRDVLAHLTGTTRTSLATVVVAAVRARGSFDRMEIALARRASRRTTEELVALLRESATTDRRFPMSTPMDPLMDLVIHAQDIARPLGLEHRSPPEVVAASLAYVADNRFLGAPRRRARLRILSTDTGWAIGDGALVKGPDLDLLLALTGRPAGLAALDGPGVPRLTAQL